ncbi:MAG: hypothetical protein M5U12_29420 [Verrucomicrobia bacterium]|nr:hypothetical protein [Verrucomicrobiota bacterium]
MTRRTALTGDELDAARVRQSLQAVRDAGLKRLVRVENQDLFGANLSEAAHRICRWTAPPALPRP